MKEKDVWEGEISCSVAVQGRNLFASIPANLHTASREKNNHGNKPYQS